MTPRKHPIPSTAGRRKVLVDHGAQKPLAKAKRIPGCLFRNEYVLDGYNLFIRIQLNDCQGDLPDDKIEAFVTQRGWYFVRSSKQNIFQPTFPTSNMFGICLNLSQILFGDWPFDWPKNRISTRVSGKNDLNIPQQLCMFPQVAVGSLGDPLGYHLLCLPLHTFGRASATHSTVEHQASSTNHIHIILSEFKIRWNY